MPNFFRKHLESFYRSARRRVFPQAEFEARVRELVERMVPKTDGEQRPNPHVLSWHLRDIDVLRMNVKNYGFQLGKALAPALARIDVQGEPAHHGLVSKPTTQADVESPWFVYWCQQLGIAPVYHRKLWEFAFTLQALHEAGLLAEGKRGIGFGCGEEPLASYFASRGMSSTVTDLSPEQVAGKGWTNTQQHASTLRMAWHPDLVDEARFLHHVDHKFVDMNDVPDVAEPYDFCWSICALEHLGSIEKGLAFVENAMKVLKPGGIAVHTTEFNYSRDEATVDNWQTVLFQRRHFQQLAERLAAKGHTMLGPDFDVGDGVLDGFVDVPPYTWDTEERDIMAWDKRAKPVAHLKLAVDGFPTTCFGIVVRKGAA
ncbi:MAG TPA: class I SAM-dependent methyltransferase [Thermomonas sp.]|nr:class I SAM-dependent methyltransferase [Thermomonas sp.]